MAQSIEEFYPQIFRHAANDVCPWEALKQASIMARVCKLFEDIISEQVRPEILLRILPGLDRVWEQRCFGGPRLMWTMLADTKMLEIPWSVVDEDQLERALDLRSQARAGSRISGFAQGVNMVVAGIGAPLLAASCNLSGRDVMPLMALMGMAGGAALLVVWPRVKAVVHRTRECMVLGSLESAQSYINTAYYPKKNYRPRRHSLKELSRLKVTRLVKSKSFHTKGDSIAMRILAFCTMRAKTCVQDKTIRTAEAKLISDTCCVIWDIYRHDYDRKLILGQRKRYASSRQRAKRTTKRIPKKLSDEEVNRINMINSILGPELVTQDLTSEEESEIFLDEDSF